MALQNKKVNQLDGFFNCLKNSRTMLANSRAYNDVNLHRHCTYATLRVIIIAVENAS